MKKKVLIAGGSGYIGKNITKLLQTNGFDVAWLSRTLDNADKVKKYFWNYESNEIDNEAFTNTDIVINLAGASINAKRWTNKFKQEIYNSRVSSTEFLINAIKNKPNNIKKYIQSSAIGYYGIVPSSHIFVESDNHGSDFLAKTCSDWEKTAQKISDLNINSTIIRIGVVISKENKTFLKIANPVRLGFGASIGTGKQFFPWIHINDLCEFFLKTINDDTFSGIYNAVAPEFITNEELNRILAKHYHKPLWLPNIPKFVMKLLFGEVADYFLYGNKISAEKIKETGFNFKYKSVKDLL